MENNVYHIEKTFTHSSLWDCVEKIKGMNPYLGPEPYLSALYKRNKEVVTMFEEQEPCSSFFLLHYSLSSVSSKKNPVLLVHGASHDGNMAWVEGRQREKGMAPLLIQEQYDVFAITFAHSHGDNYQQMIQLSNALLRIEELTKCEKIDIIAHSKGGVPVRMYLSNMGEHYEVPYIENVDKYIMLGTPNKGIDFSFRHSMPNWFIFTKNMSAPLACDSLLVHGRYRDTTDRSIYNDGGVFKGQQQMLLKWDDVYPIRTDQTLYYGGQNVYLHSRGIDRAIAEGGHLMETLQETKIHQDISVFVLAGKNNLFNYFMIGETDGPSDGLVFIESVLSIEPMIKNTGQIKRKDVLFLNHSELLYHEKAKEWIKNCLNKK